MKEPILIVGAGGHGRAVAEAVLLAGRYEPIGFVDDGWPGPGLAAVWNCLVLGDTAVFPRVRAQLGVAIVAIGNNAARERLHGRLRDAGFEPPAVVHPSALVSPRAVLGALGAPSWRARSSARRPSSAKASSSTAERWPITTAKSRIPVRGSDVHDCLHEQIVPRRRMPHT